MAHRTAPQAENDLDDIWYYVGKESGSIEVANHLIDTITDRFFLLSMHPYLGRARDDFGTGFRSLTVGEYVIVYSPENGDVLILRVVHGRATRSPIWHLKRALTMEVHFTPEFAKRLHDLAARFWLRPGRAKKFRPVSKAKINLRFDSTISGRIISESKIPD